MKKLILATILLLVANPALGGVDLAPAVDDTAITVAADLGEVPDPSCETYGCDANLVRIMCGYQILTGTTRLPVTWYGGTKAPAQFARVTVHRGDPLAMHLPVVQLVPINWMLIDYTCCCPSEWYGEFAVMLDFEAYPGDELIIQIGNSNICETRLIVGWPFEPQLSDMPVDAVVTPVGTTVEP